MLLKYLLSNWSWTHQKLTLQQITEVHVYDILFTYRPLTIHARPQFLENKADKVSWYHFVGTMLTMVLLMRALEPLLHEEETDLYLEKLTQVDSYRQGYYKDLSK